MTEHRTTFLSLTLAVLTTAMISGCSSDSESPAPATVSSDLTVTATGLTSETAWKTELRDTTQPGWVLTTSEQGLIVNQTSVAGEFRAEYGDQRGDWIATINDHNKSLVIHNLTTSENYTSSPLPFAVEGLCLYQPQEDITQIFILGDDHLARQYLLNPGAPELLSEIRTLPLPPGAENCVVSDDRHTLFISEEAMGVWAYNASPEAPFERTAVDLVAPFGSLAKNAGGLAIVDDQLIVASTGDRYLSSYRINDTGYDTGYEKNQQWGLNNGFEIETFRAWASASEVHFSAFDDASGELFTGTLPLSDRTPINTAAVVTVIPSVETDAVISAGDAADDPAIWVNGYNAEASLIIGTDKQYGLDVYDLSGKLQQRLDKGRLNNVDIRYNLELAGKLVDMAAASHRDLKAISLFAIDQNSGQVSWVNDVTTTLDDVYGLCMAQTNEGTYVFINDQDGRYEQYRVISENNHWTATRVREFSVPSQPEGCVADDQRNLLFVGEEAAGVWLTSITADKAPAPALIIEVNEHLVADVEGMALYQNADSNYLVVSSQGDDSYVLYDAHAPYAYIGRFQIGMNAAKGIDGASETDGLEVTSAALGSAYPEGLLVVQDGRNVMPSERQNFKIINWEDVEASVISRQ